MKIQDALELDSKTSETTEICLLRNGIRELYDTNSQLDIGAIHLDLACEPAKAGFEYVCSVGKLNFVKVAEPLDQAAI